VGKRKSRTKKATSVNSTDETTTESTTATQPADERPAAEDLLQAELNVGTIGHVDHGKSTLVQAMTGKFPDTHSEELRRGITIRLGYADFELRFCEKEHKSPHFNGYTTQKKCPLEKSHGKTKLIQRVSFVDAPGHEVLMATMLSGAAIMDGVILVISATEPVPMPQTREHLAAMNAIGMEKIIVVQNKVELVSEKEAEKNYLDIYNFLEKEHEGGVKDIDIIPISAIHGTNIDILIERMKEKFPRPSKDTNTDPHMSIARSFDINRPGTELEEWTGGIVGGVITEGIFNVGDDVEILPGINISNKWKGIESQIQSLRSGFGKLEKAYPGGLIGIGTDLDPAISKNDKLVGHVVGKPGKMPPVWTGLDFTGNFMKRVVGSKVSQNFDPKSIGMNIPLMLNVGTAKTVGIANAVQHANSGTEISTMLKLPVCANIGARVAISTMIDKRWRLVGWGQITGGKEMKV
jgi:translation initiation factor 2 subunit 3